MLSLFLVPPATDIRTIDYLGVAWDDNTGATYGLDDPYNYVINLGVGFALSDTYDGLATEVVNACNGVNTGDSSATTNSSSGTDSTVITVSEGFTESGRGGSPQHWTAENYTDYEEIYFTEFDVVEEFPRETTATLKTPVNIDLTSGRVACMITGECNTFSGIFLDKSYNSTERVYEYTLQGFMERIMANQIYLVANGGKTAYDWIKDVLADLGLPDTGLLPIDDYDTAVSQELIDAMNADASLTETSDDFIALDDTSDEEVQPNEDSNENSETDLSADELNPFKMKPAGIYDSQTISEWIRTLIFDYGINVDFYGDLNGVPQFEIMDMDEWRNTGWLISAEKGFGDDYDYEYDITDVVTQVAVKNISAINGTGEIYTSEELLGVNLAEYVGRMGTLVDNPSTSGSSSTSSDDDEEEEVTSEVFQDSMAMVYDVSDVLTTNGKPSCTHCAEKNGGVQPAYQEYTKYWYNWCPGCNRRGALESDSSSGDGDTRCTYSDCGLVYCQFCGYEREHGNLQLTELTYTKASTDSNSDGSDSTDTSS